MKLYISSIALAYVLPITMYCQDSTAIAKRIMAEGQYPNVYTSGSANVSLFTNKSKKIDDWSISAGAGTVIMKSGSLYSLHDESGPKNLFGWTAYFSVDKTITHAFGLKLQYDKGETRQGKVSTKDNVASSGAAGRTQYDAISILGDVNISNLFRRVDNHSPYKWALHAYGGVGTIAYRSYLQEPGSSYNQSLTKEVKPFKLNSFYAQLGTGLKYRISKSFDLEGRVMYSLTGGKGFDGARGNYVDPARAGSNDMINATLGLTYNIGKHESHLFWHDPLQEIYYKLDVLENKSQDIEVCKKGDADNDGVCDDWDRELNTPAGARVDGSGRALDVDLDGVIDPYDKCVTIPGPAENNGCPVKNNNKIAVEAEDELKGVYFQFGKAIIKRESSSRLDTVARIIKYSDGKYLLTGHTDAKRNGVYNLQLSKERAAAIVEALEARGVSSGTLKSKGAGSAEATVPATASDAERMVDRNITVRVVDDNEWSILPKKDYSEVSVKKAKMVKKVIKKKK
ncbi:OmpA family protein [Elizabethkingia sp. HX XZB]|uniref:OmpA family protein n=1 Tax=Elizabethkingia sp. HX XZB TaxID=3003193 RepID=UPI002A24E55C|nr:OmpA family protein [Elizabethkingia sp. HX XZB]MDX8569353.1 OmpA family protein [Elizabethkingia sp. HX XZB]